MISLIIYFSYCLPCAGFLLCVQRSQRADKRQAIVKHHCRDIATSFHRHGTEITNHNYNVMDKHWREKLFGANTGKTELGTLGFPLSLSKALRILDITYRTWKRWEPLAMTIPEYKLQHNQLHNRASISGGKPPVTPYQSWVVGKIGEIYTELPDGIRLRWMAKEYIDAQKDEFTRAAYLEEQARFASKVLIHEQAV